MPICPWASNLTPSCSHSCAHCVNNVCMLVSPDGQLALSIQFSIFCIAQDHNLQICHKELYNLYTYDLISDQEKNPRNRKNAFMGKKGKKPSEEQQRRIPFPGWSEAIDVMCTERSITELYKHIQWAWQSVWIVRSRHGLRSKPPKSIRQMEVERRSGRGTSAGPWHQTQPGPMRREVTKTEGRKQS